MNIFNRVKEYFNKDSDNKASQTSPSKQPDKGTTDKPEHRESANISRVFSFSSLDDITNAACIIDTFYKDANSVYKNPSDRRYYLCISKTNALLRISIKSATFFLNMGKRNPVLIII